MTNSNCLFMLFRELRRPLETVVKFWKHIWGEECVWGVGVGHNRTETSLLYCLLYFRCTNCFLQYTVNSCGMGVWGAKILFEMDT